MVFRATARSFVPQPAPEPLLGAFTLRACYRTSGNHFSWWMETDELVGVAGREGLITYAQAERADTLFDLDIEDAEAAQHLMAVLAPPFGITLTPGYTKTYGVSFYCRTQAGMERMKALHSRCYGVAAPHARGQTLMSFFSELDVFLRAFAGVRPWDLVTLEFAIQGVQAWHRQALRKHFKLAELMEGSAADSAEESDGGESWPGVIGRP